MNNTKRFLSFTEARQKVRSFGFRGYRQWRHYSKTCRPPNIPSDPRTSYKDEWVNWMDWMGYEPYTKKYTVNEDFFKTWSSDMAYVLGFWFTDGYIYLPERQNKHQQSTKRYIFGITQCELYILENISVKMQSSYPIHTEPYHNKERISYRFFIESRTLVEDLMLLGGRERKSLTMVFPQVPAEYLPDFVRGLWDGDGSIFRCKTGKIVASLTSGSKLFLESLLSVLTSNIPNFRGHIYRNKRRKSAYILSCGLDSSRRLRDFMYTQNSLFLKRKRDTFDSIGAIGFHFPRKPRKRKIFADYDSAHKFAAQLGLSSHMGWNRFSKSGQRPSFIPSSPHKVYNGCGWKGWIEWFTDNAKETINAST